MNKQHLEKYRDALVTLQAVWRSSLIPLKECWKDFRLIGKTIEGLSEDLNDEFNFMIGNVLPSNRYVNLTRDEDGVEYGISKDYGIKLKGDQQGSNVLQAIEYVSKDKRVCKFSFSNWRYSSREKTYVFDMNKFLFASRNCDEDLLLKWFDFMKEWLGIKSDWEKLTQMGSSEVKTYYKLRLPENETLDCGFNSESDAFMFETDDFSDLFLSNGFVSGPRRELQDISTVSQTISEDNFEEEIGKLDAIIRNFDAIKLKFDQAKAEALALEKRLVDLLTRMLIVTKPLKMLNHLQKG